MTIWVCFFFLLVIFTPVQKGLLLAIQLKSPLLMKQYLINCKEDMVRLFGKLDSSFFIITFFLFFLILPSILQNLLQNTGKYKTEGFATIVNGFPNHTETSPLICSANKWTGLDMIGIVVNYLWKAWNICRRILENFKINGNMGTRWVIEWEHWYEMGYWMGTLVRDGLEFYWTLNFLYGWIKPEPSGKQFHNNPMKLQPFQRQPHKMVQHT